MKKIIFSFLTMLLASVVVTAQVSDTTGTTGAPGTTESGQAPGYQQGQQGDFVKITADELPASVSKSLEGNEYNNWNVSNAYKNNRTGEYRVEMRSGTQTKVYTFDKDGKRVDKDKMGTQGREKDQSTSPQGAGSGSTGTGSPSSPESGSGSTGTGTTPTTPDRDEK